MQATQRQAAVTTETVTTETTVTFDRDGDSPAISPLLASMLDVGISASVRPAIRDSVAPVPAFKGTIRLLCGVCGQIGCPCGPDVSID